MTEITVKSDRADAVKSELRCAVDGQRRMVQGSIARTEMNLAAFEHRYGFSTPELLRKEAQSSFDDRNLELIEWIGETRLLQRLRSELELLDEIQICS